MRNIGIVCEGPTDYTILKEVIDQERMAMAGRAYGNGAGTMLLAKKN